MASDDINKSANLKVPPLRIVINNNNNNSNNTTNNNITNGTNNNGTTTTNIITTATTTTTTNNNNNINGTPSTTATITTINAVNSNLNSITPTVETNGTISNNNTSGVGVNVPELITNNNNTSSINSLTSNSNNASSTSNSISTAASSNNIGSASSGDPQIDTSNNNKDQSSSSYLGGTQRITRSSQRAAQQNPSMTSADDQNSNSENIDKGNEQGRKTKKRKVESPENDQDSSASTPNTNQQPSLYQPPAQNSFQLYKNIRNQVDKRIKSLNCIHPKTPHGFKDFLLNRGVYLLNGNIRMQQSSYYASPEQVKAPNNLAVSSPLHQLFLEQEKARHKMRMHHIKEREKLTLSAEQEILRVYNQAALAAANQLEPFSVCTLLKHQEIYNYIEPDEPSQTAASQQAQDATDGASSESNKGSNDANDVSANNWTAASATTSQDPETATPQAPTTNSAKDAEVNDQTNSSTKDSVKDTISTTTTDKEPEPATNPAVESSEDQPADPTADSTTDKPAEPTVAPLGDSVTPTAVPAPTSSTEESEVKKEEPKEEEGKSTQEEPMELSDDARNLYNKKIFFGRLQDIDDKWERIKCDMLIRHKNEAESLYAVQKLEWEWKAKEIGVCDVRTTPTIEQIYVPKVDVISLDY